MAEVLKTFFMDVSRTEIPGFHRVVDSWVERQLENDVDWKNLAEAFLGDAE